MDEQLARRGAENLISNHLRVVPRERVAVFHLAAAEVLATLMDALRSAGADAFDVPLERWRDAGDDTDFVRMVESHAGRASASMYVSQLSGPSFPRAQKLVQTLERTRVRHLHVPGVTLRMLGGSLRADPAMLETLNLRLAQHLEEGRVLRVTSASGTRLEVELLHRYPMVRYSGVPAQGAWDSVPTGAVSFHSPAVSGTYVADRIVVGTYVERTSTQLFRRPLKLSIAGGRLRHYESEDAELVRELAAHLGHDRDADIVGFVSMSTNYLTKNELKVFANDALLPGLRLMLGYSDPLKTKAPRSASVWATFLGRGQTVSVDDHVLVRDGRLDPRLTEGILPF